MGSDDFQIPLVKGVRQSILDATNVNKYGPYTVYVLPGRFAPGTISDADMQSMAMFAGVALQNTDDGLNIEGDGLSFHLGGDGDGGDMYAGADDPGSSRNLEDQLDALVFSRSNGLTKGTINASATMKTIRLEAGTTALEFLETICAVYDSPDYEYRIDPDFTVHVDTRANLFRTSPNVLLSSLGGREGQVTGLVSDLQLPDRTIEDYRTTVTARNGTINSSASQAPPALWKNPDGSTPVWRTLIDPRARPFRARPKWSTRVAAAHYAAWALDATDDATKIATSLVNRLASLQFEVSAEVMEFDPCHFVNPGDSVWVHDVKFGLIDRTNEVYFRGPAVWPQEIRLEAMTCPLLKGYGVYARRWTGAGFEWLDLTDSIAWEDGPTTLELGRKDRLHRRRGRPRRINRRRLRNHYRDQYILDQYVQSLN